MANVIETKIMKDHQAPIVILKLSSNVPCDIVIDFGKILDKCTC